jgi:hypothetical protein
VVSSVSLRGAVPAQPQLVVLIDAAHIAADTHIGKPEKIPAGIGDRFSALAKARLAAHAPIVDVTVCPGREAAITDAVELARLSTMFSTSHSSEPVETQPLRSLSSTLAKKPETTPVTGVLPQ